MAAALALSERGRGRTAPNPNVGCVIVADGRVVGRGWTQPGGRPHAEAMALAQAGAAAQGATVYVTLEPCAHESPRGPACADGLIAAGPARVVAAIEDPDPRTAGEGFARLRAAGIVVETGLLAEHARRAMAGFLTRRALGRPLVTLKLATSLDGQIALADGSSRWITGEAARAHVHLERSRHEAILVGRGTWEADAPRLDVRLAGLEARSPRRILLSSTHSRDSGDHAGGASSLLSASPRLRMKENLVHAETQRRGEDSLDARLRGGGEILGALADIASLTGVDHLFVEGGAQTAASFLRADLVDRLLLYRAPILIGAGKAALGDIGLGDLADAHERWRMVDGRMLGSDRLEVYERVRH
ncbi:bifunctional diaminohydroxyphosphoribosylaminopyrimidine deaminase/5-amino-6-(5-phosphoribosylamino)uracil reductase RibD [Sphingomonas sp. BIUV-7]|uniref:Riboflavin biosynthesis protein RibD n=1 Tax=Sphingomonas natans TaxID=3063330 RepID=A0ABT8Y6C0_9SPHN|nr:bifunctional diaminohydroxyphosphoribosylaminopyrimidine deaminase/5-amino-6-(5-phosphoribosylamino)uracil reductase RibD [Sphingomonas sp. BIUV-7]MDO6413867.1 bifunctional diaminohydroxyphosphoribosylaminopyrimidine deaminase/5-amino-6-(5-phosphoribosylamino)uracil reductase RibD [Sphingomonas sp. BIUV-7]